MTNLDKALAVNHFIKTYTIESITDRRTAEQAKGALEMLLYLEAIKPERCKILLSILDAVTSKH